MLGKKDSTSFVENSALVSFDTTTSQRSKKGKSWVWRDTCNIQHYTCESLWKFVENPQTSTFANEVKTIPVSKEQVDHLLELLKSNSVSSDPGSSLSQGGRIFSAFSSCLSSTPGVIGSGASDHLTSLSHLFTHVDWLILIDSVRHILEIM